MEQLQLVNIQGLLHKLPRMLVSHCMKTSWSCSSINHACKHWNSFILWHFALMHLFFLLQCNKVFIFVKKILLRWD